MRNCPNIHDKINKAYRMLGLIKRNFKYLTTESFTLLYKNIWSDRNQITAAQQSVWCPYRKGDIEALEKVQKKATKILPQLKKTQIHLELQFLCRTAH